MSDSTSRQNELDNLGLPFNIPGGTTDRQEAILYKVLLELDEIRRELVAARLNQTQEWTVTATG